MAFQVRKDTSPVALSSDVLSEFTALLRLTPARADHFTEGKDEVHLRMAELGSEPKALEAAVVRGSKTRQSECPGGGGGGGSLCSPTRREKGWQDPGGHTTSQPSLPLALSSPGVPAFRSTHVSWPGSVPPCPYVRLHHPRQGGSSS